MPVRTALVLLCLAAPCGAAEPWADRDLPAAKGLLLWLDASRQPAAYTAQKQPSPRGGAALGIWYDGSGNRLHLVQRHRPCQPTFAAVDGRAAVRFDGKQQWLGLAGVRRQTETFTLFLVARTRSNTGGFRAFFAANGTGQRDYSSGFNVDMSWPGSPRFDTLNVEGKGFGGVVNLLDTPLTHGTFRTLEIVCEPKAVRLVVDGKPAKSRPRTPGPLGLDELTLGARFYSNEPVPNHVQGFLDGDIAEVLLYDRALDGAERERVRAYLARKHAGLTAALVGGPPPRTVAKPPPVQVLLPGFAVRQLPIDLPNINNIKYRADGKLVALGYNGNVYLLSDSDGDGLEDRVEVFHENKGSLRGPIGMALTPPGYKHGEGVFVAAKGKVVLLAGGKETVVATGWKEITQAVDALGVAVKDGKVYFGLGTADFTNAYQLAKGKARYDLKSERGTIIEVSDDFKSRKIVSTGIRFPVALAFNRKGDLFATDQEGATWLPNGNPFDELLHIRPGRHYGFPPRHPKHLPGVIDEPSTFDYGPQHQSTCGLNFNDPVRRGGPVFGPPEWTGDAIVAGYARGKLYRTQLVHTPDGYIARNHLLACLNMLTVDACVSPQGDLVVVVHSGPPDWGTGPAGKGKLYKITHVGRSLAQPVAAWPAGPRELRISFDRAVEPYHVRDVVRGAVIEYGPHVRAGDRFEVHRPGYAVVQDQLAAPRRRLPIYSASLLDDGRTLSLSTAPHPVAAHYAVTLPGLGRPPKPGKDELPQHAEVDLDYDLCGVEAEWKPAGGKGGWLGWLPHLDPVVSRDFLVGSAAHAPLWDGLPGAGRLTLKTKLDLWQLLRPATQPGSTLDHTWPAEHATIVLRAACAFSARLGSANVVKSTEEKGEHVVRLKHTPKQDDPVALEVVIDKERGEPRLRVAFSTSEDDRPRPLPLRRFLLPWATLRPQPEVARKVPELEGGNWLHGRRVFFSDQAACGRCHVVDGRGGKIGPDLSNLVHRDYASVRKDVVEPSAALNPDHISYLIQLFDGRVLTGVPRDGGDGKLIVGDTHGNELVVRRDQIESMTASKHSLMPDGIDKVLGREKMRDLMTFLLTRPLAAAAIERDGAPSPRTWAEVEAALKAVTPPDRTGKRLRILLAAGPKDHGPGEHDYPLWQRRWFNLLSLADDVSVEMVNGWPGAARLAGADVVVFYSHNPGWTADAAKELEAFLARGGGAVYLHYAVDGHRATDALAERIGLAWRGGASRFRHGPLELTFGNPKHPITRGLGRLKLVDESYWRLAGDVKRVDMLATGVEEGKPQPLMWARQHGKGRVFVSIPGHYNWTFDDPLFRLLILRGVCWTAGEPADRLSELITVGARVGE